MLRNLALLNTLTGLPILPLAPFIPIAEQYWEKNKKDFGFKTKLDEPVHELVQGSQLELPVKPVEPDQRPLRIALFKLELHRHDHHHYDQRQVQYQNRFDE